MCEIEICGSEKHKKMSCNTSLKLILYFTVLCFSFRSSFGKKHLLTLEEDDRKQITVSTFGFLKGGILFINITNFKFDMVSGIPPPGNNLTLFGFTLDKSGNSGLSTYMESEHDNCILQDKDKMKKKDSVSVVFFKMDLARKRIIIDRKGDDLVNLTVSALGVKSFKQKNNIHKTTRREAGRLNNGDKYLLHRQTRDEAGTGDGTPSASASSNSTLSPSKAPSTNPAGKTQTLDVTPGKVEKKPDESKSETENTKESPIEISNRLEQIEIIKTEQGVYNSHFLVHINCPNEEGLYNLFFHNCLNYEKNVESTVSMSINIVEVNNGNYLSAGDQPEPMLYFIFFLFYFLCGCFWLFVLRRADKGDVFKIHYLMLSVVWVKSLSCLFHGINSHFIEKSGIPEEAWAILWYIVYLTRGALMFGTILLIGAGWAFIKHMLSKKEKKLFAIFIPLQILDQVAWVIVEESDEGLSRHATWKQIFFVVDLLCCGAILFPVVWSIRHLQDASTVDGKAAMNLNKLKLFRHFYIMVVCYIYFTRMIVYLLEITLPFRHEWLKDFSKELAVFLFFFVTGYKFQPATDNPYLQVPVDSDEDIEMEEVLTKTGATEGLTKVNQHFSDKPPEEEVGIKQRESSLEYD